MRLHPDKKVLIQDISVTVPRRKRRGFPLLRLQLAQSQTYASLDGL